MMARGCWFWLLCLGMAVIVWAQGTAQAPPPETKVFTGETKAIGGGTVTSWVVLNAAGHPQSLGMTLSEGALANLPDQSTEYSLALPPQAGATPFRQLALDWQPHGHVPVPIYGAPHFDAHFYLMTPEARAQLTPTGRRTELRPAAAFVPRGWRSTGEFEPFMGFHWYDPAAPEFHGQPFTATLIYGFFAGRMTFIEPMFTLAFLQARPNLTRPVPLPERVPTPGYYPTQYTIRYDGVHRQYLIALHGFTQRTR